jgi:hypothetical protein
MVETKLRDEFAKPAMPPTPEAERALAEAEQRRAERARREAEAKPARELNGRDGPDPVRYGDWEVRGLASDF